MKRASVTATTKLPILSCLVLALILSASILGCQRNDAVEEKEDHVYLLIFALNVATLEPVVIKDCVDYRPKTEQTIEGYVADLEKGGQTCEKGKGIKSWTCTDEKSVITKLTLLAGCGKSDFGQLGNAMDHWIWPSNA
jgi:hypothetical protein